MTHGSIRQTTFMYYKLYSEYVEYMIWSEKETSTNGGTDGLE